MKLPIAIIAVILVVASAYSVDTPSEVAAAKTRYQTALAAGNKSAREQFLQELQKLRGSAKAKKNRAFAEAVDEAIQWLNKQNEAGEKLPYGKLVPGKPGLVTSPYEPYKGYIDVQGLPPGARVMCPYSQKPFLVPEPSK